MLFNTVIEAQPKTACMKQKYLLLVFLLPLTVLAQQSFQAKALTLCRFLDQHHYQPVVWNDSSADRLYTKWINQLDEEKFFFTQQEINALTINKKKLADEMNGKGWNFFNQSVALYKMRLKKTDSIIQSFLAKPIDFTKPDNISWPFKNYAITEQELTVRWQQYLKWRLLSFIAEKVEDSIKESAKPLVNFNELETVARAAVKKIEVRYISNLISTQQEFYSLLQDEYLNAIAWCYDPHTTYMNLKEKKEFETEMSASAFSAGIGIDKNDKGEVSINYLQPGGSAWRSGQLHMGDVITKVKSNEKEKDVAELDEDTLEELFSGNDEADVVVTVRTAAGELKTVTLHKEKLVDEESVVKSYVIHGNKNIGYINLPGFYSREEEGSDKANYNGCANDVSKEMVKLKKDTIAGLILDLRFNGGGSMWEAMQLAGIFIDIGPVASVKEKNGAVHFLKDPNRGTIYDGPLIVLINGASASASEFVSAALQDYNRAIIMGENTYGKGTAQKLLPMDTNTAVSPKNYEDYVKVTETKFYRINGNTTQWEGVKPDIVLPGLYGNNRFKEKANASALLPDKSKVGTYEKSPPLPLTMLEQKSKLRVQGSNYYKGIQQFNLWQDTYFNGRNIPLQWNTYYAHFLDTKKLYKKLNDDNPTVNQLAITNNIFDWKRINQSTNRSKEINLVYIEHLQNDEGIAEAYRVFADWLQ